MRPANFLITARTQFCDDQVAFLVKQKEPVAVLDDEGVGPTNWFTRSRGLEGFPDPVTCIRFQTPQLTITANTVNAPLFEEWRGHNCIEVRGIFLTRLFSPPNRSGRRFGGIEVQHERAVVEGREEQQISEMSRRGDAQSRARLEWLGPID